MMSFKIKNINNSFILDDMNFAKKIGVNESFTTDEM